MTLPAVVAIPRHPGIDVAADVFDAIIAAVNAEVLGRSAEVHALMVALVARQNVFALSRPGEAKTMMIGRTLVRIDGARRFSCQLDAFSGDDTMFGNWSVKELAENDVYRRSAKNNAIQHAHVAEVDEVARASAATLSSLLRITNEGEYMDAGDWVKADLSSMFSSANSLPWIGAGANKEKAENLAAFWDRIAIRLWMPPTTDLEVLRAILDLPAPDPEPVPLLAWAEVEAAQQAAAALPVPAATRDALIGLVRDLSKRGIAVPSPRRLKVMETVAKANAWLRGADHVGIEHLDILTTVFPHTPDDQDTVDEVVYKLAAPQRSKILDLGKKASEHLVAFNEADKNPNDKDRANGMSEAYTQTKRTAVALAAAERAATPGDMPFIDRVWPALTSIHERTMRSLNADPGDFRQLGLDGKITVRS